MRLLFPADPTRAGRIDPDWSEESEAAAGEGVASGVIDVEALVRGDTSEAVRRVRAAAGETALYRGWMLRPAVYSALHQALVEKGFRALTSPTQYAHAHLFPATSAIIAARAPRSAWMHSTATVSFDEVHRLLEPFGAGAIVLKDFVKSRKHEWNEACFIPHANDRTHVERVVRRFVELQGDDLEGGLVFREFVPLATAGAHPKSGMPLSVEFRSAWLDGVPLFCAPYWDEAGEPAEAPPLDEFREIAGKIAARFFTMDLARTADRRWLILEIGDGQVSSFPRRVDTAAVFRTMRDRLP